MNLAYLLLRVPNSAFRAVPGWADRPVVYPEPTRICPDLARLDRAYADIKAEYHGLRERLQRVPRYHEVDRLQYDLSRSSVADKNWRVFFLEAMGLKAHENRRLCPRTAAVLDEIPGVFQAFFSVLEGGKSLPQHESPYWGYLRYHLALEVPSSGPAPRMRVRDQWITWHEGTGVLFDDSWAHELVNDNDQLRTVLIVDVARPAGWFCRTLHRLTMHVMRWVYAPTVIARGTVI